VRIEAVKNAMPENPPCNGGLPAEKRGGERGFTVVELSVVIIISAIIMMPFFDAFFYYQRQAKHTQTLAGLDKAQLALIQFQGIFGRYPCPADPSLKPSNPLYGREDTTGASIIAAGTFDTVGNPDQVMIGALPVATLIDPDGNPSTPDGVSGIDFNPSYMFDGWGRKLTYAVTASLCIPAQPHNFLIGAITIEDENQNNVLPVYKQGPPVVYEKAQVILVSHGENGRGAWTREGVQVSGCGGSIVIPPGTPTNTYTLLNETTNCDGSPVFLDGLGNTSQYSYYDDIVKFFSLSNSEIWNMVSNTQAAAVNPGNVAIGLPDPSQPLDLAGNLQAQSMQTPQICDQTGVNCMLPKAIGGQISDMSCDPSDVNGGTGQNAGPGTAISGIQSNRVVCTKIFNAPPIGACPAGQYAYGVSNIKGLLCR
jgi:prepilin-type N-terminal cleavage/methylation domain-containing protein